MNGTVASPPPPAMRWWAWGEEGHGAPLGPAADELLRSELGIGDERTPPVALEQVELPAPAASPELTAALEEAVGAGLVSDDHATRVSHAAGRSFPDLHRLRTGKGLTGPDVVAYPGSRDEVAAVIEACAAHGGAVVPFGGGTSVVGGVEPLAGARAATVCVDLARMSRVLDVDRRSLTATIEPGARGPHAETQLAEHGVTLGHFPQSFEYATVGGFVATRSAGQASTGYGRIDKLVLGLRCATPTGELVVTPHPGSAAGPALRELVVGSEGTLGVITEATLAVAPVPEAKVYETWMLPSFSDGVEAFRALEQSGRAPDVTRLSDEEETRLNLAVAYKGSLKDRIGRAYLRARRRADGCLVICGFEGEPATVAERRARASGPLRDAGGVPLGTGAGKAWSRGRYGGPYFRDELLDRGVFVETLETATTWTGLDKLYRGVGDALREALSARGTPPLVMCHVSHLYRSGASLYFTFLARADTGAELDQWAAAKTAASDAIIAAGGTITHHHAVGHDHARWMTDEIGERGLAALRALKRELDPDGVMNPGKLLPS